ncbi:CAP-Gly domain-containing linker protein 1 [Platysternon megacephalum]|uniref:CAP-Gly domain-containing linker protein 1 n=1 Tax=Platysternon megacephalum TaxID=55544 RepID=A0A4D9EY59_9SAUR|nr:CAP-Gly domain-containing linker protein 1 [Platysternon megacephalum]
MPENVFRAWGERRRETTPAPKPEATDTRCLIEQGSSTLAYLGKDPFRGLLLCVILSTLVLGFLAANRSLGSTEQFESALPNCRHVEFGRGRTKQEQREWERQTPQAARGEQHMRTSSKGARRTARTNAGEGRCYKRTKLPLCEFNGEF